MSVARLGYNLDQATASDTGIGGRENALLTSLNGTGLYQTAAVLLTCKVSRCVNIFFASIFSVLILQPVIA